MIIEYGPSASITASASLKIWPNAGYKWKLLGITGYITTGSTAGTRSAIAYILAGYVGGFPNVPGAQVLDESTTSTSSTVNFNIDVSSLATNPAYRPLEITDADALELEFTLISGDSLYYVVRVDQDLQ